MTPHLSEGALQRLLDGELSPSERARVDDHLTSCSLCRSELSELETTFATLSGGLALLDPPEVSVELAHAAWRKRLAGRSRFPGSGQLRRAALFLVAFAGVASAAVPGSPIRNWLESAWGSTEEIAVGSVDEGSEPAPVPYAGVSVAPADGELLLVVDGAAPALRIRVRLADEAGLRVRGIGEAAGARFRMGRGRITVEEVSGGELEVLVSRDTPRATITVDGRRILIKQGDELHVLAPADTSGPEIVFPGRP